MKYLAAIFLFFYSVACDPAATAFCSQFAPITNQQNYYCSADFSGFYQCLQSGLGFEAEDSFQACAPGTTCLCPFGVECNGFTGRQSPCGVNVCEGSTTGCGNLQRCTNAEGQECGGFGSFCLEDIDSQIHRCGLVPVTCGGIPTCMHNADCPVGSFCGTNNCCNEPGQGLCFSNCY